MIRQILLGLFLFNILIAVVIGGELHGRVVGVADGDTITVLDDVSKQHKIRLYGIDAPEKKQDWGQASKKHLSEMVFGKNVKVVVIDTDRYNREVGKVYFEDQYINLAMVKAGMAWHYVQYAKKDTDLAEAQSAARIGKLGLWSIADPIPPWEFRHKKKIESNIEE